MKKRILVYSPNPLDGVSFYRQWGPLTALHDKLDCVSFSNQLSDYINWVNYLNYDICLMSRPHKQHDYIFALECKKFGLPLWVDYDDDLFNITPDNPVYHTFASDESRKCITEVLKMADVVSVATKTNKEWLEKNIGLDNVEIIPNAMDDRLLRHAKPFSYSNRLAWRGSDSHREDLYSFADDIASVLNKHREHQTVFFGMYARVIEEKLRYPDSVRWAKPTTLMDFIHEIARYNPKILFVPLIDNQFNRVKSHLAWFDATIAGAVCLGPNFPEWIYPGLPNYSKLNFVKEFSDIINEEEFLKAMHRNSLVYIKDNLLLSKINSLRLELINNLTPMKGI